ncbi:DUF2711 family protein [Falsibacillus pallidus]|uniref:Uncharacterized protein DUF2711 n=1 Tax=Falsibacillus pallidus TaxID=493781 RepID=A0A370GXN6_9BACI|nr:DUF2711 family protein [Falsibacillus pallidus]RDI48020.1 uncharacterized protein DUF2711 [Falsibacillus pallidus]
MLQYKWLNGSVPILEQLPAGFSHAALLLHPFIQLPKGYAKNRQSKKFLSDEEIIQSGTPVKWEKIMQWSGLDLDELGIALQTGINALNRDYAREDLYLKVNAIMTDDLYYPNEDVISALLFQKIMTILQSKGARYITYDDPIGIKNGRIDLEGFSPSDLSRIALREVIIADENLEFAFMSRLDSLYTLFVTKEDNICQIVDSMDMEAIICTDETYVDWYFKSRH